MSRFPIHPNELQKGDVVNVVDDKVIFDHLSVHGQGFFDSEDNFHSVRPNSKIYLVKKAPTYPANYPPQEGDVWTNGTGRLFFITKDRVQTDGGYGHSLHEIQEAMASPTANYKLLFRK